MTLQRENRMNDTRPAGSRSLPLTALCAALGAAMAVPPAVADSLEESIVTARKRIEAVQDVPIAITVLRDEEARRLGVRNLMDLNEVVPGIEVQDGTGTSAASNIYIRGVGQRFVGVNIDSGVGIYLDDIYVGRADGGLLEMTDIQNVQVLRGPQGTLFGKNTTGGAILVETKRPTPNAEGVVRVRAGNEGRLDGSLSLNAPLSDSIYTRLSLQNAERDGWMRNVFDGRDYSDEDRLSVIWQTRWRASDTFTADLNLVYSETDQAVRGAQCVNSPGDGWLGTLYNLLYIAPSTGQTIGTACDAAEALPYDRFDSDLGGSYYAENQGASVALEWAPSLSFKLKSITGWRSTETSFEEDADSTALTLQHVVSAGVPDGQAAETDQYSQEFQFIGDTLGERLFYVAGVYYFYEETTAGSRVFLDGPWAFPDPGVIQPPLIDFPGVAALLGTWTPGNQLYTYISDVSQLRTDNEAWAAYGQAEYHINDSWRLTLGLRYTDETREADYSLFRPDPATLSLAGPGAVIVDPIPNAFAVIPNDYIMPAGSFNAAHDYALFASDSGETGITEWTPLITLQYMFGGIGPIDYGSAYIQYTDGFLSGGLYPTVSGTLEEFQPETVEAIEVGVKFDAFAGRFRANLSAFTMEYNDRQLVRNQIGVEQNPLSLVTINAESATINGFEVEAWALPADSLQLQVNLAVYDAEIDTFTDEVSLPLDPLAPVVTPGCEFQDPFPIEVCPVDRSDENLPLIPETQLLLAAQYRFDTGFGTVTPRIQWSKKWDIERCLDRASCLSGAYRGDDEDLSARVSWISPDQSWEVAAYGTNLTDEQYIIGGTPNFEAYGLGSYVYAPPRLFGVEFSYGW
jgi:iron complex outermembrane receptor protein